MHQFLYYNVHGHGICTCEVRCLCHSLLLNTGAYIIFNVLMCSIIMHTIIFETMNIIVYYVIQSNNIYFAIFNTSVVMNEYEPITHTNMSVLIFMALSSEFRKIHCNNM